MRLVKKAIGFIVEGVDEEKMISKIFSEDEYDISVYGTNSDQFFTKFWGEIEKCGDDLEHISLDILLKRICPEFKGKEFAQYYLLFDLDVQQDKYGAGIWDTLGRFWKKDLEGPLQDANISIFISYPMFEAIKDFVDPQQQGWESQEDYFVFYRVGERSYYARNGQDKIENYKQYVSQRCGKYSDIAEIQKDGFLPKLIELHRNRAKQMLGKGEDFAQNTLFFRQREVFSNEGGKLYVLSGLVFLLYDYYGE